jgi:hypothetical protein
MSEEKIHELSRSLADKRIEHAKLKRERKRLAELNRLESEIIDLRRKINQELQMISEEKSPEIEAEE